MPMTSHSISMSLLCTPDSWYTHTDTHTPYSDQVSMEPTRYRQDGLTRITGMEGPPGRTCSLKTYNRRLRTAALAEVIAVSQTSIGLVNIWNISFILLFFFSILLNLGKKFYGESVFQSKNHCIEMPTVCKTTGPEGHTGL